MITPGFSQSGNYVTAVGANITAMAIQNLLMQHRTTPEFVKSVSDNKTKVEPYVHPFKITAKNTMSGVNISVAKGHAVVAYTSIKIFYETSYESKPPCAKPYEGMEQFLTSLSISDRSFHLVQGDLGPITFCSYHKGTYYPAIFFWYSNSGAPAIDIYPCGCWILDCWRTTKIGKIVIGDCGKICSLCQYIKSDWIQMPGHFYFLRRADI